MTRPPPPTATGATAKRQKRVNPARACHTLGPLPHSLPACLPLLFSRPFLALPTSPHPQHMCDCDTRTLAARGRRCFFGHAPLLVPAERALCYRRGLAALVVQHEHARRCLLLFRMPLGLSCRTHPHTVFLSLPTVRLRLVALLSCIVSMEFCCLLLFDNCLLALPQPCGSGG